MTLARKIYFLMELGKPYHMQELVDLLQNAYDEYLNVEEHTVDEYLAEEWIQLFERADHVQQIRDALKLTRKYGYTKVDVKTTEAHDVKVMHHGKHRDWVRTLHYDEFKEYTYTRIK